MTETIQIKLKTLTPLWTGGVDPGKMDRVHETGIIGSLRWWYEALVRGLGGRACDPTNTPCEYNPDRPNDGLCDACQVFGATGWRRRFRLTVEDHTERLWSPPPNALNVRPPGRRRGWYLPPGRVGQIRLRLTGEPSVLARMAALLRFLERWGALGAKPQLGYGLFRIVEIKGEPREPWEWKTQESTGPRASLPDLRRFGFFRFRFSPSTKGWWTRVPGMERLLGGSDTARALRGAVDREMIPLSPSLKNVWRFQRWQGPRGVERELFGTAFGRYEPVRSKIAVSWAYPDGGEWEVRGRVWLPAQDGEGRDFPPRGAAAALGRRAG